MAAAVERCEHHHHPDVADVSQEGRPRADARHGLPRRPAAGDARAFRRPRCSPRRGCCPRALVERLFLPGSDADALATIIFSSGSTGVPKGVMLTHRNVLANIDAADRALQADAGRCRARRAALLPLLRVHRHALAAARRRLRRGLPSEPDRREDHRRARGTLSARRCSSARRPSARRTCASACRNSSRTCVWRLSARSGCASRSPPRSRRSSGSICSKATAAPRWRRSSR